MDRGARRARNERCWAHILILTPLRSPSVLCLPKRIHLSSAVKLTHSPMQICSLTQVGIHVLIDATLGSFIMTGVKALYMSFFDYIEQYYSKKRGGNGGISELTVRAGLCAQGHASKILVITDASKPCLTVNTLCPSRLSSANSERQIFLSYPPLSPELPFPSSSKTNGSRNRR